MSVRLMIRRFIASFFYPAAPDLISYDAVIKALNRRRRRLDLPRVKEFVLPERPFRPQPYTVASACSTASSSATCDYEPPDDIGVEEPRGYHP
jgi:hypothetical protein